MEQDQFWEELLRTALIGTDRHQMDDAIYYWLKSRNIDIPGDPARALLTGSGALHLIQRSSTIPKSFVGKLPEPLKMAGAGNSGLSRLSQRLLREPYRLALPEFVRLCRKRSVELPPESIPTLFEQALNDLELRDHLPVLTGAVGIWMARQNPVWGVLRWDAEMSDWTELNLEVKFGVLLKGRQEDPEKITLFFARVWDTLDYKEKQRLLGAFWVSLSAKDESFLTKALKDKRLEVRKIAAQLLLQIPEFKEQKRIWEKLMNLLKFMRNKLIIELPEEADDFLQIFRLNDSAAVKGLSLRESWLYQMAVHLPLELWGELGVAEKLLMAASRTAGGEALLRAWWKRNLKSGNPIWSETWLNWLMNEIQLPEWVLPGEIATFTKQLSSKQVNTAIAIALRKQEGLIQDGSALHHILIGSPHIWSETVSWLFLSRFQDYVQEVGSFFWDSWHYRDLLRHASFRILPGLSRELVSQWSNGEIDWGLWDKEIAYLLDIVSFRREFWEELGSSI